MKKILSVLAIAVMSMALCFADASNQAAVSTKAQLGQEGASVDVTLTVDASAMKVYAFGFSGKRGEQALVDDKDLTNVPDVFSGEWNLGKFDPASSTASSNSDLYIYFKVRDDAALDLDVTISPLESLTSSLDWTLTFNVAQGETSFDTQNITWPTSLHSTNSPSGTIKIKETEGIELKYGTCKLTAVTDTIESKAADEIFGATITMKVHTV